MKFILLLALIFAVVFTQSAELRKCIEDKCPDQYSKCKATKGC